MRKRHLRVVEDLPLVEPVPAGKPNPMHHPQVVNPDRVPFVRRLDCRRYEGCLSFACIGNWASFTCNYCDAYETLSVEERTRQDQLMVRLRHSVDSFGTPGEA